MNCTVSRCDGADLDCDVLDGSGSDCGVLDCDWPERREARAEEPSHRCDACRIVERGAGSSADALGKIGAGSSSDRMDRDEVISVLAEPLAGWSAVAIDAMNNEAATVTANGKLHAWVRIGCTLDSKL
ncbi:MAG: hypothetical protein N2C14_09755 [Planctomycetales bacterium]